MLFIIWLVFLLLAAFAVLSNKDIFSPGKLYLFFYMAFHIGMLSVETSTLTQVLMFCVLCVAVVPIFLEGTTGMTALAVPRQISTRPPLAAKDRAPFFWVLSLAPIYAQLYMIQEFGGFEGYLSSVQLRVVEWAGYGWLRSVISLLLPINTAYFAIGLVQNRQKGWWAAYAAHFALLIGISAMSGSRSAILNIFLLQIVIYHYCRARVRWHVGVGMAVALVLAAMVLGAIRETFRYSSSGEMWRQNAGDRLFSIEQFYYGVDPLQIVAATEHLPLAHGSTFLSLFTNVIPRTLWPDKPDTGGAFFTKYYAGDAWGGYSNLTPTFLGEWIINFGWVVGISGFFIAYTLILLAMLRYYRRVVPMVSADRSDRNAINAVLYATVVLASVALMTGELTNVVLTVLVTQVIPLLAIRWYVGWHAARRVPVRAASARSAIRPYP